MSVIRVGSNGTYAEGWDQIFGGRSMKKAGKATKKAAKKPAKKAAKKKAARKKAARRS
jgi:hypothetical protein